MKLRNFRKFLSAFGLIATVMLSANFAVSAQKEHGKGHSKGGEERGDDDGDHGDHGKGNNGNNGRWKGDDKQEHDERGRDQQQVWIVQQPRGEERRNNGNWQRQQQVWNDRQSQERDNWERRQQQQVIERQRQIQQAQNEWNARRQQELNNRRQYQSDGQVYAYPNQGQPIGRNLWYGRQYNGRDDKQYRKEQKRAWKEERNFEKEQRRYSGSDRRYSAGNYYDDNYNGDPFIGDGGSNWKEQLLRAVIANVIGNRLDGDQRNPVSQYGSVYNYAPYNQSYGRGGGYNAGPQFVRSYATPYNQAYQPEYGDGNSSFGGNSISGQLLNSLPIAELIERYTGGNPFISELVANFLSQGYDEGYRAGNSARRNRNGNRYYQDPYVTADGIYDPFSVSMGENRQILSEGYEMGYQDALAGRNDYDPQSDGNVDLVSLLLNNVLGNI